MCVVLFNISAAPPDWELGADEKLDPRAAIAGIGGHNSDSWQSGLFDANTWREANPGWARSVVTGRARLGGIAVGEFADPHQLSQPHGCSLP